MGSNWSVLLFRDVVKASQWGWGNELVLLKKSVSIIVKLRQGSGKEGQGMALKAKGLKA